MTDAIFGEFDVFKVDRSAVLGVFTGRGGKMYECLGDISGGGFALGGVEETTNDSSALGSVAEEGDAAASAALEASPLESDDGLAPLSVVQDDAPESSAAPVTVEVPVESPVPEKTQGSSISAEVSRTRRG